MPENDAVKYDLTKDPAFLALKEEFGKVGKAVAGVLAIAQANNTSNSELKKLVENLQKGAKPGTNRADDDDDDDDDDIDPEDLDEIPAGKFRKALLTEVGKLLDGKLAEVSTGMQNLSRGIRTTELRGEAKELAGKHKDFEEWANEMNTLGKDNPKLSLKQLYTLARSEYPEKAKELDEKFVEKPEKKDDSLSLFGGFRPTIGTDTGGKDETPKTAEEASEAAWKETVEKFPALARLGGDGDVLD